MRHRRAVSKLGRTASHRKAMLRNMVTSLLREERVETTVAKAKEARRVVERVITVAKRGRAAGGEDDSQRKELHARRRAARFVNDRAVLKKLFEDIAPRFADRPGGYTRILKTGFRQGDDAPLSILEFVDFQPKESEASTEGKKAKGDGGTEGASAKKKKRKKVKKAAVRG